MKEYEYDRATVDAWLNNGGAEIVLETLRHRGWDIKIQTGDDWPYVDDIVVVVDRETAHMEISGQKSPWKQAFFAILGDRRKHTMLSENDNFYTITIDLCYWDIDEIRTSSEAAIACMVAVSAAAK